MTKTSLLPSAPETNEPRASALSAFSGKAMGRLLQAWEDVKGTARSVASGGKHLRADLPTEDLARLKKRIQECLEPKGGEVTARANTVELGKTYLALDATGRQKFFSLLSTDFDIDHKKVENYASTLVAAKDDKVRLKAQQQLREALVAPRTILFRQFNALPDGFKFLVDMRAEVMGLLAAHSELVGVDADLRDVLAAWFDIGLLDMAEINWKSPAALLEKLMVYEAVHAIRSWDDLKNRLDADRRVFGFFHNKMPLEPLIFVQVAFTKGLADNVQELLDESKPVLPLAQADTAIFYSISNAQKGLAGISFGNFLIKRVAGQLGSELKNIKTFATLSPVPGFRSWLDPLLKAGDDNAVFLPAEILDIVTRTGERKAADAVAKLLASNWHEDAAKAELLKPILQRLCVRYLTEEKRGSKALDPVAHFHLSNGARLEQINWLADASPKGFKQSAGLMVNYHYKLAEIDENHEDYVTDGKVHASKAVLGWLIRK